MYIGDRKVNDVAPKDRDIAMVFQNYALYPHMTVYKNMAFALKLRKTPKDEIDRKVHEAAMRHAPGGQASGHGVCPQRVGARLLVFLSCTRSALW